MQNTVTAGLRHMLAGLAAAAFCACVAPATAGTLETVKQRGVLQCGVSEGLIGFSEHDGQGKWSGFDVDFCRAVAGAIFDDGAKVTFVPFPPASALTPFERRVSICCQGTRLGLLSGKPASGFSLPGSPIMTAKASW